MSHRQNRGSGVLQHSDSNDFDLLRPTAILKQFASMIEIFARGCDFTENSPSL